MRVHKGDTVEVLSGKHRGKRGQVMRALPKEGKVVVEGANMAKRHTRPRGATMQGGIIDKDMPLPVSAVAVVCGSCGATRVGYRVDEQGRKLRVCKKCGGDL
ncbi:MAG TPA: 50S ribosomal protein L24 [Acidimicrobiales bacterium]|nr:50S ribosomal protein L24 [Acidimicrobiales bacterium]